MTTPTLLLAQDDERVESSVLRLLREHFDVVCIVADGAALVERANQLRPDAVVVDSRSKHRTSRGADHRRATSLIGGADDGIWSDR